MRVCDEEGYVGREIQVAANVIDLDVAQYKEVCEVADVVSSAVSPLSVVRSVINNAVRVHGMTVLGRQKADAVKMVANANLVMAKFSADEAAYKESNRHREVVMYIDQMFQVDCDRIASEERVAMARIQSDERAALRRIQQLVDIRYAELAEERAKLIRDQEILLLLHRNCMAEIEANRLERFKLAEQVTQAAISPSNGFSPMHMKVLGEMAVSFMTSEVVSHIDKFVEFQRCAMKDLR